MKKQNQKGITLIALIITIIVMLILVGVTINVALNGGLFNKAEEATTKTKISQIQEALTLKKAELVAENNGVEPQYSLTISDLILPSELKTEYENKLKISKDGKLYYDASAVTNKTEQDQFEELGIGEYIETNTGELYTFRMQEIYDLNPQLSGDSNFYISYEEFENLIGEKIENIRETYIIEGEGIIDNDSSNLQIVDSLINYFKGDSEGKYFIAITVQNDETIEFMMIANGYDGEYIKTTEKFLEFQEETKDIEITLVKKDRIENFMSGT